jgi:nucleoside-diphosphate-sugar epimerase
MDLGAGRSLDATLFRGVHSVFHLAGIAHQSADPLAYQEVNLNGTLALADTASKAGVEQFVFLSSVKAMGFCDSLTERSEADLVEIVPSVDPYGDSKQRAERSLADNYADAAMRVQIVRPALVYGAQAKGNLATLITASRYAMARPPEGGARSMIALPDLIALLLLLDQDQDQDKSGGVRTWIATDGEQYSSRRLYDALRRARALPTSAFSLPDSLWRLVARLADLRSGAVGGTTWQKLMGSELYSNQLLLEELRFEPRWRFEDLVAVMIDQRIEAGGGQ